MAFDPFIRFLGVQRNAPPHALLGLDAPAPGAVEIENALRCRLAALYQHPDRNSDEAAAVRAALREAAAALRQADFRRPASSRPLSGIRRIGEDSPPAPILTFFDRSVLATLVAHGGFNAASRGRLVALAAAHGVHAEGLMKVMRGLSDYARRRNPPLPARHYAPPRGNGRTRRIADAGPHAPRPYEASRDAGSGSGEIARAVAEKPAPDLSADVRETIKLSFLFGLVTLLIGSLLLWQLLPATDPAGDRAGQSASTDDGRGGPAAPSQSAEAAEAGAARRASSAGASESFVLRFDPLPTFAGDARPAAALAAAGAFDEEIEALEDLARRRAVDNDPVDTDYRSWALALRTLGAGWVLLEEAAIDRAEAALIEALLAAAGPSVTERMLDEAAALTPAAAADALHEEMVIWRGPWLVRILERIANDRALPPVLRDQAQTRLEGMLGEQRANGQLAEGPKGRPDLGPSRPPSPGPSHANEAALLWLDRVADVLAARLERADGEYAERWEQWLSVQRRLAPTDENFEGALLGVARRVLQSGIDLSRDGPAMNVLGRVLLTIDMRRSNAARQSVAAWFDDDSISARSLWAFSSLMAAMRGTSGGPRWFTEDLVPPPDAAMRLRGRYRDDLLDRWPERPRAVAADQPRYAPPEVDAESRQRWTDLLEELDRPLAGKSESALMDRLVFAARMNLAAALIAAGENVKAHRVMDEMEQSPTRRATPSPRPAAQTPSHDGAWAAAYEEARRRTGARSPDERLRILRELAAGPTRGGLGPRDAAVFVREVYRGSPMEVREAAQQLLTDRFWLCPNVALEMLDQLADAPRSNPTTDLVRRYTDENISSPRAGRGGHWQLEARLALTAHLLHLRGGGGDPERNASRLGTPAGDIDERADALTGIKLAESRLLATGRARDDAVAADPAEAARLLALQWQARAAPMLSGVAVPAAVPALQRRQTFRLALADGPVQSFLAWQVAAVELLAYVAAVEQPDQADGISDLLRGSAAKRDRAPRVLEQAAEAERVRAAIWAVRLQVSRRVGDFRADVRRSEPLQRLAAAAVRRALADDEALAEEVIERLAGLDEDDALGHFELAEELADLSSEETIRDLARDLFRTAALVDSHRLGRSACLALADLEPDENRRRRFLVLAGMLGDRGSRLSWGPLAVASAAPQGLGAGTGFEPRAASGEPMAHRDASTVLAVLEAFSSYRRGQGSRALSTLRRAPGGAAEEALFSLDRAIPGGAAGFIRECEGHRGTAGGRPSLSATTLDQFLQLEMALLRGEGRTWADDLVLSRGRPLIEVDPDRLAEMLE